MKRIILSLCVFTVVLAAQAPLPERQEQSGPRTPRLDAVKSVLNLTDSQVTQLRELRVARREELRTVLESIRSKKRCLAGDG